MMDSNKKDTLRTILYAVIIILLAAVLVTNCSRMGRTVVTQIPSVSKWNKLEVILDNIEANYVDTLDRKKMTEDILPHILSALDPHSTYLPPEELKEADEDLSGEFDGIGIQFTVPADTAIVSNVIAGGPSEKAGVISGDRIISVNDTSIAGVRMNQDDMVRRMRGKKGTKVKIGILRDSDTVSFVITRDKIPVKSVDVAFMLNDTTGYVKLSKFSRTSYMEFMKGVAILQAAGMRKLIFDLRDNSGGYMDQAILISNEFLDRGKLMVYMEGANRRREDIYADGRGELKDIQLAILINEGSASSSEIVAGALQDNDKGTIYGLRSFGKGLVQEPLYFSDGSGIRLTVARYHTPTGRCIQKPYGADYEYDIYERYRNGEMMSADSIKVNDSLKFVTPGGKVVYGGGGIIPDVFVPIDTVGYTEFIGKCNRKSLQVKFANKFCDTHRGQIRDIRTLSALESYLEGVDVKNAFIAYAAENGVNIKDGEWDISGNIITTQIKALIGRYSPMDDEGFYPIWLTIDNTVRKAVEN